MTTSTFLALPSTISRQPKLEQLLKRLEQADRLFDYNMPPKIRNSYDDQALIEHLERTYTQQIFMVEEASEVAKYSQKGDWVLKKGLYEDVSSTLKKEEKGEVVGFDNNRAIVKFDKKSCNWNIVLQDLLVTGKKKVGQFWRDDTIDSFEPISAQDIQGGLQKHHRVTYTGKDIIICNYRVPDGTPGTIVDFWKNSNGKNRLFIICHNNPGVIQDWKYDTEGWYPKPTMFFDSEEIKLLVPNNVNLEKPKQEIYGEHDG